MNKTITIPSIPADWICHSGIIPAGNGYRTHVKAVLHKCDGYHSYVVHMAYECDGKWCYERGDYFQTEAAALKGYAARCG